MESPDPPESSYPDLLTFLETHHDIAESVIEYLPKKDLIALGSVNSHWRHVVSQERIWRRIAIRLYGIVAKECMERRFLSSFFEFWRIYFRFRDLLILSIGRKSNFDSVSIRFQLRFVGISQR